MYGPIANLPGYNASATYLPPGVAAPSSYPERVAPTRKFYDMAPLPSVVDPSINTLAQGGLSSSDPNSSAFGSSGISGGIGGPDGLEYKFLNDFLGYLKQPQTVPPNFSGPPDAMVPPNFSGPSNDQYSGAYLVPPVFAGPQQPSRDGTVSFTEGDQASPGYGYNLTTQQAQDFWFPQSQPSPAPSNNSQAWEEGGPVYSAQPGTGYSGYNSGAGLPNPGQFADANGVINTRPSWQSAPGVGGWLGTQWDRLTAPVDSFTVGNGVQAALGAALPGGVSQLAGYGASQVLPAPSTGNMLLDAFTTPFGQSNVYAPRGSGIYTDPGATGIDWANLTPAEQSLQKAYSSTDRYDPNTGQYNPASAASVSAMAPGTDFGTGTGGTFGNGEFQQWYAPNNNLFSLTGNMLENANWGPGTKYVLDQFDTN